MFWNSHTYIIAYSLKDNKTYTVQFRTNLCFSDRGLIKRYHWNWSTRTSFWLRYNAIYRQDFISDKERPCLEEDAAIINWFGQTCSPWRQSSHSGHEEKHEFPALVGYSESAMRRWVQKNKWFHSATFFLTRDHLRYISTKAERFYSMKNFRKL